MRMYAGARQQDLTQIHQHLTEVRVQLAQYKESARRLEEENSMLKHQRLFATPKVLRVPLSVEQHIIFNIDAGT